MPKSARDGRNFRRDEVQTELPDIDDPEVVIDDISVVPALEIIDDDTDRAALPIGADLYLLPSAESIGPREEQGTTTGSNPKSIERQRPGLAEHFGPEVTAGIVIAALFVIFAALMLLDVSSSDPAGTEQQPTQTVPAEVVEVEIGEGVTLERE